MSCCLSKIVIIRHLADVFWDIGYEENIFQSHQRVSWKTRNCFLWLWSWLCHRKCKNWRFYLNCVAFSSFIAVLWLLLIRNLFCSGKLTSSIFIFWRSLSTVQICWQSFSSYKFNNYFWIIFADSMAGFNSFWSDITAKFTEDVGDFLIQNICIFFSGNAYYV